MEEYPGEAHVVLNHNEEQKMIIGFSRKHKGEIFYYLQDGEKVRGPFYLNLAREIIEETINMPLEKKHVSRIIYAEERPKIFQEVSYEN